MIKLDLDAMTEDEGLALFRQLRDHFGWVGTVMTRNDISVTFLDEDALPEDSGDGSDLSEEMVKAVTEHGGWRYCEDAMVEAANKSIPTVEINPDGSFTLTDSTFYL